MIPIKPKWYTHGTFFGQAFKTLGVRLLAA
jgi:hypothetical protein